jgi:hypothetical protein
MDNNDDDDDEGAVTSDGLGNSSDEEVTSDGLGSSDDEGEDHKVNARESIEALLTTLKTGGFRKPAVGCVWQRALPDVVPHYPP